MNTPNTNDGGPAFPLAVPDYHGNGMHIDSGMTLRDWFAGQALAGILANIQDSFGDKNPESNAILACGAYIIADAMLAEREKGLK